jgi:FAD:protein FMN transferase
MCHAADLPLITWQGETMACVYTVKIVDAPLTEPQLAALKTQVDQRLKEVNRQTSHYQPDSELSRFNRASANKPFKVSPEFAQLVRFCLDLNRRSKGTFDPTLGPVINLWGFGEATTLRQVPSEDKLREAMAKVGCQHLTVTTNDELIKDVAGLQINLSGIAKGFGVDEMARILRAHSLTNFYVSISGEVFALGHNPKGTKWQVGISAPVLKWAEGDPLSGVVSLSGLAISTSGDTQKFFVDADGHRFGHIFDPKTGRPVQHNIGCVSVVAENSMTADALTKPLYVLGVEEGLRFIEARTNAAALFVLREPDGHFRPVPSSRFSAMTGYQP